MPAKGGATQREKKQEQGPSLLEWTAGLIGVLIAIGMFIFLAIEAMQSSAGRPPILTVRATNLVGGQGVHVLEVEVTNGSAQTAAAVQLAGELNQGGRTIETSSATLSYVPGKSVREAGLIFSRDPRRYQLHLRVTGYEKP